MTNHELDILTLYETCKIKTQILYAFVVHSLVDLLCFNAAAHCSMHKLNDIKHSQFWCGHIESQRGKLHEMWRSINQLRGHQKSSALSNSTINAD